MSIHDAYNNVDSATDSAFQTIKEGIVSENLVEAVQNLDQQLSGSQLSPQEKFQVSKGLGDKLQESGLLPRAVVDYASNNFQELSNDDRYIENLDLDGLLQSRIEYQQPVKGMIARQLRSNMSDITLAHTDSHSHHDDSRDDRQEIAKGISKKDLSKWGGGKSLDLAHETMSAKMISYFGNTSSWNEIAGTDMLLSSSELDVHKQDGTKFSADQMNTLSYMDKYFGGIKASNSGDSNFKMSLSDVVNWASKKGVNTDAVQAANLRQPVEHTLDASDPIGTSAELGVKAITAGIANGNLSQNIRDFDRFLTGSGLNPDQVNQVQVRIRQDLSSQNLLKRTMGDFVSQNFDSLSGGDKYIKVNELDSIIRSEDAPEHPTESMILKNVRHNLGTIAMISDDVRHTDTDSAEINRGISLKDAQALSLDDIETRNNVEMSKGMLRQFGNPTDFERLANGDSKVSKDDLNEARFDNIKYTPDEISSINFMRDNFGSIKGANSGDGWKITLSDIVSFAGKNGVTGETLAMEDAAIAAKRARPEIIQPVKESVAKDKAPNVAPERQAEVKIDAVEKAHQRRQIRDTRVGDANEATIVKLNPGDRIWNLANSKYGTPAIEAIFEANGMSPQVVVQDGKPTLFDPSYKAGTEIVLPKAEDVPALTEQYRVKTEHLKAELAEARAGQANEETSVKLIYGDTLSALAMKKYGKAVPVEALYMANNLPPVVRRHENGCVTYHEPTYYAGKTYKLPPLQDVEALAARYRRRYFKSS